MKEKSVKK